LVETAGVYLFLDAYKVPIYIGKAINLRNRIKQHFTDEVNPKEKLIAKNTAYLKIFETNSEFEALVLEANLVRKYLPKYNAALRDDKSRLYIVITKDEYPKLALERRGSLSEKSYQLVFGPLNSAQTGRGLLRRLRKIVPFCSEKRLSAKPCFYSQMGLCNPCPNTIIKEPLANKRKLLKQQYLKNIRRLKKILQGSGRAILADLKTELSQLAAALNYEEAILVRERLNYLEQLFERRLTFNERLEEYNYIENLRLRETKTLKQLLGLKKLKRAECFDISNLNFKEATASMVVFNDGKAQPDQYRRFKIKGARRFDPEMLLEVVLRRLAHQEWAWPELIVIDGGAPQLFKIIPALKERYQNLPLIVGLAKRPDRLLIPNDQSMHTVKPNQEALLFLSRLRDEAHRFAKKYHLLLRHKTLRETLNAAR
jgi:excinuclease ABC subunit C